jgi:hypothetical protein
LPTYIEDMNSRRSSILLGAGLSALAASGVAAWLEGQRDRYRSDRRAVTLGDDVRRPLVPFFGQDVVDRTRFVTLHADSADRPPFLSQLREVGLSESVLDRFTDVSAITYQDVVVMPCLEPDVAHLPLVFHELVHVVQFDELGLQRFIERYLDQWVAAGFRYEGIGLELDAYALQRRFESAPLKPFDARAEIRRLLSA